MYSLSKGIQRETVLREGSLNEHLKNHGVQVEHQVDSVIRICE
jgi:hypothetical protein